MYQSGSIKDISAGSRIIGLVLVATFFSAACASYSIPKGENWGTTIEIKKNPLTETSTVEDLEAKSTLFSYYEAPTAQPIMVQKIDQNHWITVLEKPTTALTPDVTVEKLSENEFLVKFKP
jgi:hypothetical protein